MMNLKRYAGKDRALMQNDAVSMVPLAGRLQVLIAHSQSLLSLDGASSCYCFE